MVLQQILACTINCFDCIKLSEQIHSNCSWSTYIEIFCVKHACELSAILDCQGYVCHKWGQAHEVVKAFVDLVKSSLKWLK